MQLGHPAPGISKIGSCSKTLQAVPRNEILTVQPDPPFRLRLPKPVADLPPQPPSSCTEFKKHMHVVLPRPNVDSQENQTGAGESSARHLSR